MFASKEHVERRMGGSGTPRQVFLQDLVNEFQSTKSETDREQVAAHLANLAYDPFNFEYMRQLNVLDLFLDCLTEPNEKLVDFGLAGLCNICLDKKCKTIAVEGGAISLVIRLLDHKNTEIVRNAMTTLMFLISDQSRKDILVDSVRDTVRKHSRSTNPLVSNIAIVFLEDYFFERKNPFIP